MIGGPIEQKAAAAPTATLIGGYLAALLIQTVPWLADNLTADQKLNLPIILAFLLSAVAAYWAPHTSRPDLTAAVAAAAGQAIAPHHARPGGPV
jgi:hypothetical protein